MARRSEAYSTARLAWSCLMVQKLDPAGKAGLASLMVDLMDEGADGLSAIELSDAMQRIAMGYSSGRPPMRSLFR